MIRYTKGAFQTLFYWWGGINRHLIVNSVYYLLFLLLLYYVQTRYPFMQVDASTNGISMLGSLTVFLLVFRMNQSMARNNEATQRTDEMFGELDFLVHSVCTFMQGAGEDTLQELVMNPMRKRTEEEIQVLRLHGELASAVRIHVVRLTIAFGVSVLLYFRVLCALSDSQGVLEEEDLVQIVFLHCRLQALLYEEEMEVVDQYMGITRETDGSYDGEAEYRAEVGRFRIASQCAGLLMRPRKAGDTADEDCGFVPQASDIVPALPKVILSMLTEVCHVPIAQRWGYPERVLNLIADISGDALDQLTHLAGLIMRPVSLAYYQHCRVIVALFSFMWPLVHQVSDDLTGNIFDSIIFPWVVYWAMSGLERLAEMMENPVGDDDTDIDLMQQMHELEVGLQLSFELSEIRRSTLRRTLAKGCPSCTDAAKVRKPPLVPAARFEDYFCWLPLPSAIAEGMTLKHGHVDHAHAAFLEGHVSDFQSFLRKALRRHSAGRRSPYEAFPEAAGAEELKVYPEAEQDSTMGMIQRDTNGFWHYLAFRPVLNKPGAEGELRRQELWRKRMVHLLGKNHPAAKLLEAREHTDSARSVLLQPLKPPKPRRHHISEALAESMAPRSPGGSPSAKDSRQLKRSGTAPASSAAWGHDSSPSHPALRKHASLADSHLFLGVDSAHFQEPGFGLSSGLRF